MIHKRGIIMKFTKILTICALIAFFSGCTKEEMIGSAVIGGVAAMVIMSDDDDCADWEFEYDECIDDDCEWDDDEGCYED